jgi:hypothetical protein
MDWRPFSVQMETLAAGSAYARLQSSKASEPVDRKQCGLVLSLV